MSGILKIMASVLGAIVTTNWMQLSSVPQQDPSFTIGVLTHIESGSEDKSAINVGVPPSQLSVSEVVVTGACENEVVVINEIVMSTKRLLSNLN